MVKILCPKIINKLRTINGKKKQRGEKGDTQCL